MPQQARLHGGVLDDGAAGRQVAAQDRQASFGAERLLPGRDHGLVVDLRAVEVLADGAAVHGDRVFVEQVADA